MNKEYSFYKISTELLGIGRRHVVWSNQYKILLCDFLSLSSLLSYTASLFFYALIFLWISYNCNLHWIQPTTATKPMLCLSLVPCSFVSPLPFYSDILWQWVVTFNIICSILTHSQPLDFCFWKIVIFFQLKINK